MISKTQTSFYISLLLSFGASAFDQQLGSKGREARAIVQSLQERKATIHDHIPEFAALVMEHTEYVRIGLLNHENLKLARLAVGGEFSPPLAEGLRRLEVLQQEAQQRLANQNVTYPWWVAYNLRLAYIATIGFGGTLGMNDEAVMKMPDDVWASHENMIESLKKFPFFFFELDLNLALNQFPSLVALPKAGDLSLADFNELVGSNGHFLGLMNAFVILECKPISPVAFIFHDVGHAIAGMVVTNKVPNAADPKSIWPSKIYQENARNLSRVNRQGVDLVYFMFSHEDKYSLPKGDWESAFGPDLNFDKSCPRESSLLAFFPSDVVDAGEESAKAWFRAQLQLTQEFFESDRNSEL